jgi:uncharacterized repeat protein (TIGR01451 family)/CSLREA domain-containing protein
MRKRSTGENRSPVSGSRRKRLAQLGAVVAAGAAAGTAQAATITVNSLADTAATDGQCTLREALNNANANAETTGGDCTAGSGVDVVQFQVGLTGTILLGGTQLSVTDSVSINGPGVGTLAVSGNNASRIFYIYNNAQALAVTISGLTLMQGNNPNGSAVSDKGESLTLSSVTASVNTGDAVFIQTGGSLTLQSSTVTGTAGGRGIHGDHAAALTITGSTLSNNATTGKGGGLFLYQTAGTIAVDNSIVFGNTAASRGGGISLYQSHGAVTISNSQITSNTSSNRGGGIHLYKVLDDVTIQNTTISGNTAASRGGGMFFYKQPAGKTLTISGSTISGNTATSLYGGAIFFYKTSGTTVIEDTTISGNSAPRGGGIVDENIPASGALVIRNSTINGNTATTDAGNLRVLSFPSVTIQNSIVANGTAPLHPDLQTGAANVVVNYSLIEDPTGATFTGANNITGTDPQLGALANNGGPTQTHLPALTSPVLNAGDPAFAPPPATDQRGMPRVAAGRIDMGSVESNGGTIQLSSATASVGEGGGSVTITINRTGGTDPAAVNYATSNGSAAAPGDYTATSGTANFMAGATSATFNVPIIEDATFEGNETFNVTLSSPSANAVLGAPAVEVVTIVENDPPPADLAITKTDGVTTATPGGSVTYLITASNAGPSNAPGSTVADTFPASLTCTWTCGGAGGGMCTAAGSGNLNDTVNLPTGGSVTYTANCAVSPLASGMLSNTATVTVPGGMIDPNPGNNSATDTDTLAPGSADLAIIKTASGMAFFASQPMTYNISVSNAGPTTANAVVVTDVLPAGATFVSATPSQGSCSGTTTVTCSLGTIANGGSATIALSVSPTAAGPLSNTATVSAAPQPDPNPANNAATAAVTVQPASAIPLFGGLAKILLALTSAIVGLFMLRKQG